MQFIPTEAILETKTFPQATFSQFLLVNEYHTFMYYILQV